MKLKLLLITVFSSICLNTMAQQEFLLSVEKAQSVSGAQRVAMIFEGAWWENEIKDYFGTLADRYGAHLAYKTRKFGFMPTPKSDDGKSSDGTTLISSTANSAVFIYSGTQKMELAKDFFKFELTENGKVRFSAAEDEETCLQIEKLAADLSGR